MTRGIWQVTTQPVVLPPDLAAELPAGLPSAAEPWSGPGQVRTDPGAFAGLDLPLVALGALGAAEGGA